VTLPLVIVAAKAVAEKGTNIVRIPFALAASMAALLQEIHSLVDQYVVMVQLLSALTALHLLVVSRMVEDARMAWPPRVSMAVCRPRTR